MLMVICRMVGGHVFIFDDTVEMMMTCMCDTHLSMDPLPGVYEDTRVHEVDDVPGVVKDVFASRIVSIGNVVGQRAPNVAIQVRFHFTLLKQEKIFRVKQKYFTKNMELKYGTLS